MPENHICKNCQDNFEITPQDLAFYDKVSPVFNTKKYLIPAPTLCPSCREQRRLSFRNERKLYSRSCDLCKKNIISIYSPEKKYTVYCSECWWGEGWNPFTYGQKFDFNKSFFEQFKTLWQKVPMIGLWTINTENAEYNNNCFDLKDSYMNFNTDFGQNNYYSYVCENSNDIMDSAFIQKSELCYECIDCRNAYHCTFSSDLENCQDCYFSSDLIGCKNCFGCHGLRHKEYYIFNQKVTPEEWQEKMAKLTFTTQTIEKFCQESLKIKLKIPKVCLKMIQCEDSEGDHLYKCKNSWNCFDAVDTENVKNASYIPFKSQNVQDAYAVGGAEWAYEFMGGGLNISQVAFINNTSQGLHDSYYCCLSLNDSKNLFGCIGLKHQQYCILNKQYTREEYEDLVPKIIEHMMKTQEWGEYFPVSISPFAYNETLAQEFFPLNEEQIKIQNWLWKEKDVRNYLPQTLEIPLQITDVKDEIITATLACSECQKNYRIILKELVFYRKMQLPVPRKCPDCRYMKRMSLRNPRKLYARNCGQCKTPIQTTYAPNSPEIVYCETCYLKEQY